MKEKITIQQLSSTLWLIEVEKHSPAIWYERRPIKPGTTLYNFMCPPGLI